MTIFPRAVWTAYLGNFFEHYDTALFGCLSPFLAPLIFPQQDPITALILTYAMIPLGMLARPIGSLVFGYIGDAYGRSRALFLTLAGMSFVSVCFALIPSYAQIGILAPLLFCLGRIVQNFLAAGETMGGAIWVLENARLKHHDWLSGLYSASTMGGHLLASFGVFLLSHYHAIDHGWRWLYLFGCITAFFGCIFRRSTSFPPLSSSPSHVPLGSALWKLRKLILHIAIHSGFASACYTISLVLINGFIPLISSYTKVEIMGINSYLLLLDVCSLPFFGWLASKISRQVLMLSAALGVTVSAIPLFLLLKNATLPGIIVIRICLVTFGVAFFAPFHAWVQELVPPAQRYIVISLGYALGYQLLGSPTAAISLWLFQKTGWIFSICWYWMALAIASSILLMINWRSVYDYRVSANKSS